MKGIFRFLALLLLSASSFAEQPPVGVHAGAWAGAEASARASAGASVKTAQTAAQQVAVTVSQPAAAASSSGSKSTTTTIRSVPDAYAPTVNATAPCRIAVSAGVVVVGIGVSGGGSVEDDPCNLRETARLLDGIGQREAAARLMCNDARAAAALGATVCPSSAGPIRYGISASVSEAAPHATAGEDLICDQAARFDDPVLAARNDCR